MTFAQITPILITGTSIFVSIFFHWRDQKRFWRPTLISGLMAAIAALVVIFLFQDNYLNFEVNQTDSSQFTLAAVAVAGLGFFYGLIISALIGYVLKIAPSFFD